MSPKSTCWHSKSLYYKEERFCSSMKYRLIVLLFFLSNFHCSSTKRNLTNILTTTNVVKTGSYPKRDVSFVTRAKPPSFYNYTTVPVFLRPESTTTLFGKIKKLISTVTPPSRSTDKLVIENKGILMQKHSTSTRIKTMSFKAQEYLRTLKSDVADIIGFSTQPTTEKTTSMPQNNVSIYTRNTSNQTEILEAPITTVSTKQIVSEVKLQSILLLNKSRPRFSSPSTDSNENAKSQDAVARTMTNTSIASDVVLNNTETSVFNSTTKPSRKTTATLTTIVSSPSTTTATTSPATTSAQATTTTIPTSQTTTTTIPTSKTTPVTTTTTTKTIKPTTTPTTTNLTSKRGTTSTTTTTTMTTINKTNITSATTSSSKTISAKTKSTSSPTTAAATTTTEPTINITALLLKLNSTLNCTYFNTSLFPENATLYNITWRLKCDKPKVVNDDSIPWYEDPRIYYIGSAIIVGLVILCILKCICSYCSKYSGDYVPPRWLLNKKKKTRRKLREAWVLRHIDQIPNNTSEA